MADDLGTARGALDAIVDVARLWAERLLHDVARAPELLDGAPRSRYATGIADVVRLLTEGGRPAAAPLADAAEARWRAIAGAASPLHALARAFGLGDLEQRIVAALIAPEHDPAIERVYAYVWDDFTRKRPDLGFVADLVGAGDPDRRDRVRAALAADAPLRRYRLVMVGGPGDADTTPPARRAVRLADRVIGHLQGDAALDPALDGIAAWAAPVALAEVVLPEATVAVARRAVARAPARVLVHGPGGVGKTMLVRALAHDAGRRVLRVDLADLLRAPERDGGWADRLARAFREAALAGATLVLRHGGGVDVPSGFADRLAALRAGVAVTEVHTAHAHPAWLVHAVPDLVEVAVAAPPFAARVELWRRGLAGDVEVTQPGAIDEVAARFAFGGGAIRRAAERARTQARLRDPDAPRIALPDLTESARVMLQHRLGTVARRVTPGFGWDDLVLPDDTLEIIRELVAFAKHRAHLLEVWGWSRKLPYGRGVSAVLAGPPGTGKTMVAQLLAGELGYDLYVIELAQVVNKYVGETEKNLARVFDEAEGSHAILFFDEADALFAKRTEVKSSNDRYANLEVNYLLQRMETYNGITLLATNLEQGLDEAFKRRVRFHVMFEMPEPPVREQLWRSMFPREVPLADDIDWKGLAERYEMAGGHIKKAAIRAAARAAARGAAAVVGRVDLEQAALQEYREMGRVIGGPATL